ncbi:NeuD/PglB/VioB family sugar acetyltransferase [Dietzia sp. 111N12-1]|uniref:NeuD/PglB/VioB family sugar acetyltransferase n=1 Tax=Dietzia sp. 111N12-1 TaxID=1785156 RepID=UPI00082CCBC4|nr:NeuD/PglB/VioB family sugar acetyltransferase [Dietzia sp. 111N12-1]
MSETDRILVVGAGGHGREIACLVQSAGLRLVGFADDNVPALGLLDSFEGHYLGAIGAIRSTVSAKFLLGLGSGVLRETVAGRMKKWEAAASLVDPMASVGIDVRMGLGSVVFAQATVTTNVTLGLHTHIGRGAAIGHDCVLGDFVTVMPLASVSGNVTIGDRATIGAGAVIRQGQTIGADAFIGAGAVVVDDVPAGATVVGNPARPIAST